MSAAPVWLRRSAPGYMGGGGQTAQALDGHGYMTAAQLGITLPLVLPAAPPAPFPNPPQSNTISAAGLNSWMLIFTATGNNIEILLWYVDPRDGVTFLPTTAPLTYPLFQLAPVGVNLVLTWGHLGVGSDPTGERGRVNHMFQFSFNRDAAGPSTLTDLRLWGGVR